MKNRLKRLTQDTRFLVGTFVLALIITAISSWILLSKPKKTNVTAPVGNETASVSAEPFTPPEELKNVDEFNVLLLGYGGAGHDGGYLTDVIQLVHFDTKEKTIAFISVPRDLWVKLPDGRQAKINAAFVSENAAQYPLENVSLSDALSGAGKTKSVIEQVTGLTPHFFVGIDFNSFQSLIDKLGGVDVDVPESFEDPWYPIKGRELELCEHTPEEVTQLSNTLSGFELEKQFPCRYEDLKFSKGKTHLDGETALKFVRSRHSATGGTDFARSKRQQALLVGVRDGLLSKDVLKDPVGVYNNLSKLVQTNLNENLVKNVAVLLAGIGDYKVINIYLNTENILTQSTSAQGAFILIPKSNDWKSVQTYIQKELHPASAQP